MITLNIFQKIYSSTSGSIQETSYHLTPDMRPLYSKDTGVIFSSRDRMQDTKTATTTTGTSHTSGQEAAKDGYVATKEPIAAVTVEEEGKEKKDEKEVKTVASAEGKAKQQALPERWAKVVPEKERTPEKIAFIKKLESVGVSPLQYEANKQYYETNRALFETILDEKTLKALRRAWRDQFLYDPEEYNRKRYIIDTFIAQGITPQTFLKNYDWEAFFKPRPKYWKTISFWETVAKRFVDIMVKEEIQRAAQQGRDAEGRDVAYARSMWAVVNEKLRQEGNPPLEKELESQQDMIKMGYIPDANGKVRKEDVERNAGLPPEQRIAEIRELLGIEGKIDPDTQSELLRIHEEIGKGKSVYEYTPRELGEKMSALQKLTKLDITKTKAKSLLRAGLMGQRGGANGGEDVPFLPPVPEPDPSVERPLQVSDLTEAELREYLGRAQMRRSELNDPAKREQFLKQVTAYKERQAEAAERRALGEKYTDAELLPFAIAVELSEDDLKDPEKRAGVAMMKESGQPPSEIAKLFNEEKRRAREEVERRDEEERPEREARRKEIEEEWDEEIEARLAAGKQFTLSEIEQIDRAKKLGIGPGDILFEEEAKKQKKKAEPAATSGGAGQPPSKPPTLTVESGDSEDDEDDDEEEEAKKSEKKKTKEEREQERIENSRRKWRALIKQRADAGKPFSKAEIDNILEIANLGYPPPDEAFAEGAEVELPDNASPDDVWQKERESWGSQGVLSEEELRERGRQARGEKPKKGKEKEGALGETLWEQLQGYYGQLKLKYRYTEGNEEFNKTQKEKRFQELARISRQLYESDRPNNIEDLAWQIGHEDPINFGVMGNFPVLEVYDKQSGKRVIDPEIMYDPEGNTDIRINKGNFVRWLRTKMMYYHDDSPDDELNFWKQVRLEKQYRTVSLGDMVENPSIYFRQTKITKRRQDLQSELSVATGERKAAILKELEGLGGDVMEDLMDEVKREAWLFSNSRTFDLTYRSVSGVGPDMIKTFQQLFGKSPFSKTVWGNKSSFYWLMTMDQEFSRGDKDEHDRKAGQALNAAYLAYYNLTDIDMLRKILGEDSKLINEQGLREIRDKMVKSAVSTNKTTEAEELEHHPSDAFIDYLFRHPILDENDEPKLGADGKPLWEYKYDSKNRKLINEWAFVDKMNIFGSPQTNALLVKLVRNAISEDIVKKYGLYLPISETNPKGDKVDDTTAHFVETFAFTMTRWTGAAARNNHTAAGYDSWVKLQKTRPYRLKQSEPGYGGAFGNNYTVHMLKSLGTDFMTATQTLTPITSAERENVEIYKNRPAGEKGVKTPLEVLMELNAAWGDAQTKAEEALANGNREEADRWLQAASTLSEKAASQLIFPDNTMKYFMNDHVKRGWDVYEQIMDGFELKLEAFTKVDPIKGIVFEKDKFQEKVQDSFIKPMRYFLRTWKQIDFSQTVRENVGDEAKVVWKDITMAEKMFGREVLDIPEFWKVVPEGTPGAKKVRTRSGADGKWQETWRMAGGSFEDRFDATLVQGNRDMLLKQIAKVRLAAELYSHVDWNSTDPRYNFIFYETVLQALKQIPGGIAGDETDLKSAKLKLDSDERFFSDEDIKWIRAKSNTQEGWLFTKAFIEQGGKGFGKGLKEMWEMLFKHALGDTGLVK